MKRLDQEQEQRIVECLRGNRRVIAGYAFGSQTRAGISSPRDVDLAVLGESRLAFSEALELRGDLARAIGTDRLDLVDLRAAGPVLQRNIIASDRRIYCRDEGAANAFELLVLSRYRDSAHRRRLQSDILLAEYTPK